MKRLLLLRHAKSSRKNTALPDHDRPLTKRGEKNARRMGGYLRHEGLIPDLALCSTAVRAVETWKAVVGQLERQVRTVPMPELYTADVAGLLQTVRASSVADDVLLLIGHNPALEELALSLAGSGEADALGKMRRKFPPGGLAVIHFDTAEWTAIAPGSGELERFVRPKQLQS